MARLIDADALLNEFLKRYTERERDGKLVFAACEIKQDFADMISNFQYTSGFDEAVTRVENFPSADVAPVRHGHWIIGVDNDDFDVKCSKCEWTDKFEVAGIAAVERIAKTMHYCPNCGARMEEEASE